MTELSDEACKLIAHATFIVAGDDTTHTEVYVDSDSLQFTVIHTATNNTDASFKMTIEQLRALLEIIDRTTGY